MGRSGRCGCRNIQVSPLAAVTGPTEAQSSAKCVSPAVLRLVERLFSYLDVHILYPSSSSQYGGPTWVARVGEGEIFVAPLGYATRGRSW